MTLSVFHSVTCVISAVNQMFGVPHPCPVFVEVKKPCYSHERQGSNVLYVNKLSTGDSVSYYSFSKSNKVVVATTVNGFVKLRIRTYTKSVEPVCHSLHVLRPSHCPTSRNEQRRKPHDDVYINIPEHLLTTYGCRKCSEQNVYAPHRASPLLCF